MTAMAVGRSALRRAATILGILGFVLVAAFGMTGAAEAATPVAQVTGSGHVSYNGEYTSFSLDLTGNDDGSASGSCAFRGAQGTVIDCTSVYDFRVDASNKITTRGTALFNGRPISFTAVITDGGTGPQDSYTLFTAGRIIYGRLIDGNVSVLTGTGDGGQAQVQ